MAGGPIIAPWLVLGGPNAAAMDGPGGSRWGGPSVV